MTTTDIGILLIILCVLLWAIMAALHRHTVQLEALKTQLRELLDARQADSNACAAPRRAEPRDDSEHFSVPDDPVLKHDHTLGR